MLFLTVHTWTEPSGSSVKLRTSPGAAFSASAAGFGMTTTRSAPSRRISTGADHLMPRGAPIRCYLPFFRLPQKRAISSAIGAGDLLRRIVVPARNLDRR